jgi:hypothetical protein
MRADSTEFCPGGRQELCILVSVLSDPTQQLTREEALVIV